MIPNNQKTSLLVPNQLPEFVKDNPEYSNFVLFIQAYYEWLEQTNNVTYRSKNILNYKDIDNTTDEFLAYYVNDFLPYFPTNTLIDKQEAIKVARQLYQSKGTPASYKFLFKILYNSDFDIFYTKDAVLKASDGIWYVAKSLKLSSDDLNWQNTKNYRVFGETSKSFATIESVTLAGTKTEVFISDIERLFQSGEMIRVVDSNNQDILFDGAPLRAKLLGQISQLKIDPANRGLLYQVGDPVIVYKGLNSNTGIGATAEVGSTTTGSIKSISVVNGGFGYSLNPNTTINISNAPGASAYVASVNPDPHFVANVTMIPTDSIALKRFIPIGNSDYHFTNFPNANANTKLSDAFSFSAFSTYPLSAVLVNNGGGGITQIPKVEAQSLYSLDTETKGALGNLGILAPIQIASSGNGYQVGDTITISGGNGLGAYANVKSVAANGAITEAQFIYGPNHDYPLGGMGYTISNLPQLAVSSANVAASNASLYIPGILGQGASFSVVVDRAGSVTTISLLNPGEDYIATPNVSLKVQDIVVSNVSTITPPEKGDVVYQGTDINSASYFATVNSISLLTIDNDPVLSKYNLRVFEYNSQPDPTKELKIDRNINMVMANTQYNSNYNQNGVRNYGDGTAKATAKFLNGLTIGEGQYLNSRGQPSSYSVLQDSKYNNFTYEITVEKELAKYKEVLLNLLHPSGMRAIGRYAVKSNSEFNMVAEESVYQGQTLYYYTNDTASNVSMASDFTNRSTNVVQFNNIGVGTNIADFIFANSTITIGNANGPNIHSEIVSIDYNANSITLASNSWLTYMNVAYATGNSGSNVINITSLTGAYDIMNNGIYSNTAYPLKDIIFAGDKIQIANNSVLSVDSVDYINGIITLTTNLTANANSLLSVNRTFFAGGTNQTHDEVRIYGPLGVQYYPQLTTESGQIITTESGQIILLG